MYWTWLASEPFDSDGSTGLGRGAALGRKKPNKSDRVMVHSILDCGDQNRYNRYVTTV